jgi:hypothetical protein
VRGGGLTALPHVPTRAAEEHLKADAERLACPTQPRPLPLRWKLTVHQNDGFDQPVPATPHSAGMKERSVTAIGAAREREWLEGDVAQAALLTDADRIRVLRDLLRTTAAIRRTKSPRDLRRDEEIRRAMDEPGRARYRALVERLTPTP